MSFLQTNGGHNDYYCSKHSMNDVSFFCAIPGCFESLCLRCKEEHFLAHKMENQPFLLSFSMVLSKERSKAHSAIHLFEKLIESLDAQSEELFLPVPNERDLLKLITQEAKEYCESWKQISMKLNSFEALDIIKASYNRCYSQDLKNLLKKHQRNYFLSKAVSSAINISNLKTPVLLKQNSCLLNGFQDILVDLKEAVVCINQPTQAGFSLENKLAIKKKEDHERLIFETNLEISPIRLELDQGCSPSIESEKFGEIKILRRNLREENEIMSSSTFSCSTPAIYFNNKIVYFSESPLDSCGTMQTGEETFENEKSGIWNLEDRDDH